MKLFDIRTDDSQAYFITAVNRSLEEEPGNLYVSQFGLVCSDQWWGCFERGELPTEVISGKVLHSGPKADAFGETEDIVEFESGDQIIGYNRVGAWAAPIRVGDRVSVTRTMAEWLTRTGPMRCEIDLWAEWKSQPAEP